MTSPALTAIARLRRLAAALEVGEQPDLGDGAWLAERLARYLDGAERGLTVETALDLAPMPGQASWWTEEATQARDDALRQMAARFWPERRVAGQAYEIHRAALRYVASAWRFDRGRADMPERYVGTAAEWLWQAFASGATMPLSKRQLQSILAVDRRSDAA